jgi:hypothetical protein
LKALKAKQKAEPTVKELLDEFWEKELFWNQKRLRAMAAYHERRDSSMGQAKG